jgi:hypothetical protein
VTLAPLNTHEAVVAGCVAKLLKAADWFIEEWRCLKASAACEAGSCSAASNGGTQVASNGGTQRDL